MGLIVGLVYLLIWLVLMVLYVYLLMVNWMVFFGFGKIVLVFVFLVVLLYVVIVFLVGLGVCYFIEYLSLGGLIKLIGLVEINFSVDKDK